jgi:hypothetical protein
LPLPAPPARLAGVPEHEHADAQSAEATATAAPARDAGVRSPAALALSLQRSAGNAATARLLSRFASPQARTGATGQDDRSLAYTRFTGAVYTRAPGEDATGIAADDVKQGLLGDCYFLSPVMAVARINPNVIHRLIHGPVDTWADGTRVYDVDLYEGHWYGNSKRRFRITDRFVTAAGGGSRYAQPGDVDASGGGEIWVMLLEKAWAALRGGYDQAHSGVMGDGITAITGGDYTNREISGVNDDRMFREISEHVRDHKPVTIQTKQTLTPDELAEARDIEYTIHAKHAYNVASVNAEHRTIDIMNPHGRNHLVGFPLVRVRHFFDWYVMGDDALR